MRVLQLSDVYFPRVNGVSTSIETFRRRLRELDVEVLLVAPRYGSEGDTDDVLRVAGRPVPGDPEDRLMRLRETAARASAIAAGGVDLIHVHTPFAAHLAGVHVARRLDLPVLVSYHTLFEEYARHYVRWLPRALTAACARAISRHQCQQAERVIAPSGQMRERLLSYGVTRPIDVLPTGVEGAHFAAGDRQRFRRAHDIPPGRPVALTVSRLAFEKNIGMLVEAVVHARRVCPDMLLLIAGQGPAEGDLKRQVERCGVADSIRFLGYLDRVQMLPDCYAAADLFVFASRTETQGLVLLEAMAAGTPVLALASMGASSILAGGRGCLRAPDDAGDFGRMIGDLLNHPEHLDDMSAAARQAATAWSAVAKAGQLYELYMRIGAGGRRKATRRQAWKARTKGRAA
ncbi:MAG: glycosyltransferase [Rhodocyclaceae bacterium]|nr:glycosyltransferase [Rhodocyclaceae bacterium]